ncbi:MAG: recombination protein O N-terminal domain-containing protein [Candidatus Zambryskibacteria bacterium]|nr:recombination protein O N-terminal domain-containing protein [Candidatus Zambryskibacteria bacterium]
MSYHIYTTDGIILKRTTFGEANLLLYVLTADLGLIIASARSARLSSSKLRSVLQEYTYVSISCVRGKNGWKITNVVEKENFFFNYPVYSRKVLSQIVFVLLKMIPGESPHKEIFQTIKSGFEFLKSLPQEDISNFEILTVLRILSQLGYVENKKDTDIFLKDKEEWNKLIIEKVFQNKKNIILIINKALKESHL